jgi:hypothetical protein
MAPLTALLPYTCQGLRVVWHMGGRGEQQGEEGVGIYRSRMVETPEEIGALASTDLLLWTPPLVHGTPRELGKNSA